MTNQDVIQSQNFAQRDRFKRVSQRDILPLSIKNPQLATDIIKNTTATQEDTIAVGNGAQLNATSTIASTVNSEIIIASVPYMIAFFEASLTAANLIPFGANVDNNVYDLTSPIAIPQITTIGNDGFNLVYKTALYNGTGGSKNIIVVTQVRVLTGSGGTAS